MPAAEAACEAATLGRLLDESCDAAGAECAVRDGAVRVALESLRRHVNGGAGSGSMLENALELVYQLCLCDTGVEQASSGGAAQLAARALQTKAASAGLQLAACRCLRRLCHQKLNQDDAAEAGALEVGRKTLCYLQQ